MFGKHFASMYSGSMVGLGADVFAVWGYVIGNTKPPGEVDLNPRIVAAAIGMTAEEVEAAIRVLESEDPKSRNKEHDGRRLVAIGPYRYSVVSWSDYRKIRNDDDRREYNRLKQREHRAKIAGMSNDVKQFVSNGQPQSSAVSPSRSRSRGQIQKQERKSSPPSGERMALSEFDQLWEACEKKVAKGEARKAYLALRRKGCDPSLDTLLAALKPLQDSHAWSKDGRQFQPNLATWLRREGWLEKPTTNGKGIPPVQPTGGEFTRWALIQLEDAGKTFDPNAVSAAVDPMTRIEQVIEYLHCAFNVQPTFR